MSKNMKDVVPRCPRCDRLMRFVLSKRLYQCRYCEEQILLDELPSRNLQVDELVNDGWKSVVLTEDPEEQREDNIVDTFIAGYPNVSNEEQPAQIEDSTENPLLHVFDSISEPRRKAFSGG